MMRVGIPDVVMNDTNSEVKPHFFVIKKAQRGVTN
jgi:hypothetical protein